MKKALLLFEDREPLLISADQVKAGEYSRKSDFVDQKYEFKLEYVSGAKNNGGPYFRLYYSYEDYKKLYPDRADRYKIVANMRRYDESQWHKKWKERFSSFCDIEKCIKNIEDQKWKFADAYYEKLNTCIEFQHSYISFDFEERNKFYNKLAISTIWLYDLSNSKVRQDEQGCIEILEDNAKGFFRISENSDNLKNNRVYIQVESGMIYRVRELFRRESSTRFKSTVRYFVPSEIYSEHQFVEAVKLDQLDYKANNGPKTLHELWSPDFKWIVVQNIEEPGKYMTINRDNKGEMYRDFKKHNSIMRTYLDSHSSNPTSYPIKHEKEHQNIWVFVKAQTRDGKYVYSV